MERLWSPWRSQYIQAFGTDQEYKGCVFCDALHGDSDDERYLVKRHEHCFALLNLFPYNSGHLLIIPNAHTDSFHALTRECYAEMMECVRGWTRVLDAVMHPHGYNIGTNVGRTAGAGIDQHIHYHIVPRWSGDINFMSVIGDTKVISESLHDTMVRLRDAYDDVIVS
jgi:ATP adenylyltransferase